MGNQRSFALAARRLVLRDARAYTVTGAILVVLLVGNNSGEGMLTAVEQCVVVLVAAVPFAVQVLSTSTMAAGALQLAEKNVICTRLSVMTLLRTDRLVLAAAHATG